MGSSVTVMLFYNFGASLALDTAAPEELAVTVVLLLADQGLISSATAHQGASVKPVAGLITQTSSGTERPVIWIVLAEIWRLGQVH